MRRAEVRLANLDPVSGSEANKRRPVVIVSNDAVNATVSRRGHGVVTIVPITSNVIHVYPFQVLLPGVESGLQVDSKAQAEQVRSIAAERLGPVLGRLPLALMAQVDDALRLHLQL